MDSDILNEKGYSVVELAVALGIIAVLIVSIVRSEQQGVLQWRDRNSFQPKHLSMK